jgi:hypothetical protein
MTQSKPGAPRQPAFLDSAAFATARYARSWLVESLLVSGQPGIVGGPKKVMKTSVAIDLAISIATGTPFLTKFRIPQRRRVVLFSGESGQAVLQETARRICAAKGVRLATDCDVLWSFDLPELSSQTACQGLHHFLRTEKVAVVIIDPLYLCLLPLGQGAKASNLYEVGPILHQMARACLGTGATPLVIHHTAKTAGKKTGESLDLNDLSYAGVAEFARQWLLIGRRTPFVPGTGTHELLMTAGGSAGQSGCWELDIDEGVPDSTFQGRIWRVAVRPAQAQQATATVRPARRGSAGRADW